jgi:hypothetical protein
MCYNCLEYLVKWKGYDKSHNQWEVHTQVHAKPKIAQFHCKYPGTACYINMAIFDSNSFHWGGPSNLLAVVVCCDTTL